MSDLRPPVLVLSSVLAVLNLAALILDPNPLNAGGLSGSATMIFLSLLVLEER